MTPQPHGWTVTRLKHIAYLNAGGTPDVGNSSYWAPPTEGVPWVTIGDMSSQPVVQATSRALTTGGLRAARLRPSPPGTILFSMYASLGHTARLGRDGVWNQAILGIIPTSRVDSRFLEYCLLSLRKELPSLARSNTQQNLNAEQVGNLELPLPPLDEQRRIADFLDAETKRSARIVAAHVRLHEALVSRRWSLFQRLLRNVEASPTPLRRVLEFITDGPFGSAFSSSNYSETGAAVVRLGNIGFGEYRSHEQAFIPLDLYRRLIRHKVISGDLLIAGLGDARNHAGRACVAPDLGPAIVKGKCFCARVSKRVADPKFLSLLLSSPIGEQAMDSRGSTRAMINLEVVKSAIVPLPDLNDQVNIAMAMYKADELQRKVARAVSRQEGLLAERRHSLITAAVTGQIDVTTTRGSEV
ncbi:restriction endonuclease subunit S [Micromonospora sp. NPDC048930]|uniref:restriction endonuclease subunit S n=1 Tax=Micromonospora sp. NPDC048930 TaxID=3364261 RepID=UPI003715BA19